MTGSAVRGWAAVLAVGWLGATGVPGARAQANTPAALRPEPQGSGLLLAGKAGEMVPAPIVATEVYMWVSGIIARAQVTQRFENPTDEWIEGIYVFPLPETAAVDHLRMKVGTRVIEGQIHERGAARRVYEEAKESGRKASLVAQQQPNVFTTRVANIGPGESVEVAIEYQETIRYDDGQFHLRFPSVVAPRFAPGGAGDGEQSSTEAEDETRVDVCADGGANTFSIAIELDPGFPLEHLTSPSHAIRDVALEGTTRLVHLDEVTGADRDFVLDWAPAVGDRPQAAVFTERRGSDTYILLMMMPPDEEDADAPVLARETVFVLDTSGSMAGGSLEHAKLALHLGIDALGEHDRFNIIEFNSVMRRLFDRSVPVDSGSVEKAHAYIDGLEADGGTDMAPALQAALEDQPGPDELRQVVFITDGAVANESALFEMIERGLGETRLFTVGIGSAPNSYFMRKAAHFGRGTFTYIGSVTEVSERMGALFRKIERPALTDIAIDWSDPEAEAWPSPLRDLYRGEPVVVSARVADLDGELVIAGSRGGIGWETVLSADEIRREASGVGVLWARRKIESLMDSLVEGADRDAVRRDVLALGLEHHLVTQYTSLVAVDVTPTAPGGTPVALRVPLNAPYPGSFDGALPAGATPAPLYAVAAVLLAVVAALILPGRRGAPCSQ